MGGFVGQNDTTGTITQSYASGQASPVPGTQGFRSGGFVGLNDGTITISYATGNVIGSGFYGEVGGFAWANEGTISQSYATGSTTGNGGIAGGFPAKNLGAIAQSYSVGLVSGGGGFVGYDFSQYSSYTNDYWDTTTSGQTSAAPRRGL
jgi:The GLUG motif